MSGYDLVIFDFDGTLADTKEDVWRSLEYACSFYNCRIPRELREKPSNLALSGAELFALLCPGVSPEYCAEFCHNLRHHYRKLNNFARTDLYPGIRVLLERLRQRQSKCYIASLKPIEPLTKILKIKGLEQYFDKWFSPDSFPGRTLTKGEMVRLILAENPAATNRVLVGDSSSDIIASRENGLASVGVLYGDGDTDLLLRARPDFIVEKPEELIPLLTG